jgi:hypothetical protein
MANVTRIEQENYVPNPDKTKPVTGYFNFDRVKFRLFSRASGASPTAGKKQVLEFDKVQARELYQKLGEFLAQ